jgi:tetratricopeptide (TPR) repeat protein
MEADAINQPPSPPMADAAWRRFGPLAVAALVFLLRFTALSALSVSPFYLPEGGDMRFYHDWALRFLDGRGADGTAFYGLPGYPFLLANLYAVFGVDPFLATIPQIIAEALVGALAFSLAADVLPGRKGLVAGTLAGIGWGVFGAAQAFSIILMPTSYAILALWGLIWWIAKTSARRSGNPAWPWGAMGLLVGATATVVATILFALPLLFAGAAIRFRKVVPSTCAALIALAGVLLGASPCWCYNRFVAREPVFLSAHSGLNFFLGNHPGATGYPQAPPGMRLSQAGMLADSIAMAEADEGGKLTKAEVSRYWSAKASAFIKDNRASWARLLAVKLHHFWNAFEYDDLTVMRIYRESGIGFSMIGFGLVAALALPALFLFFPRGGTGAWVASGVILHMLSLMTVFVTERYRLPAVPGLLILAAGGLVWLWDQLARQRWVAAACYGAAGCAAAGWVGSTPREPGCWSLGYYGVGIKRLAAGNLAGAERDLILAHRYVDRNAEVHFALGNLAVEQGRTELARRYFSRALELDPRHTRALNNRAVLAMDAGDWNDALASLEPSLSLEPENAKTYYLIAKSRLGLGDRPAALEAARLAVRLDPKQKTYGEFLAEIESRADGPRPEAMR